MSEIDPVILQLRTDLNGYLGQLRSTTATVDKLLGSQQAKARQLEAEMKRSSGAIAGHLQGIAAGLAGAFGAREVAGLVDSYTRLQNSLRVAGLEGENLAQVQSRLADIGGRYGVSINALAGLYGNSSQTARELGASQAQLLQITEATAQSLKITGITTEQASGAILGLTQALASGTVRAEEFNQINEGGLRPLLQAAAASEKYGGSVAKLRQAVISGKVSSQELFQLMLSGSGQLESTAAKSTLTLAGAFQALRDRLSIYVGTAAEANGVTAALTAGINALADNLDTIIPILAAIAIGMGAKYVAGAVAASAATGALSAATFALQARMIGAATSAEALSFALAGLNINPVGLAITALGAGLAYLVVKSYDADKATGAYAIAQGEAAKVSESARGAAEKLANAHGKAREEALALARAEAKNTEQKLASARASVVLAQAELTRARSFQAAQNTASIGSTGAPGTGLFIQGSGDKKVAQARANKKAADDTVATLEKSLATIQAAINGAAHASPTTGSGTKKGRRSSGPSVEDITNRYNDERASIMSRYNSALASQTASAEERAQYELRNVELDRIRSIDAIKADKDYSDARKAQLIAQTEQLAEVERANIEFSKQAQLEREASDKAQAQYDAQRDALQAQYDLADTQDERRRIALEMVDAEYQHLRAVQDAIISSKTASDAEKERAKIVRDSLDATVASQKTLAAQSNEGPLEAWMRANSRYDAKTKAEEAVVAELENVRNGIHNALSKAIGVKDPLISFLLDNLLQEVIFKPLADAMQKRSGGGGGLLSTIGSIGSAIFGGGMPSFAKAASSVSSQLTPGAFFGRASGGRVAPGQVVRINEAASPGNVELFRPDVGGQIIPLGRTNALQPSRQQSGGVVRIVVEEAAGFASRVTDISTNTAIEVHRVTLPSTIEAAAAHTLGKAGRPRL